MTHTAIHQPAPAAAAGWRLLRLNAMRDAVAGLLLLLGVLLPWNVDSGITIAGTATWVTCLVVITSLIASVAIVLSHLGPLAARSPDTDPKVLARLRLALSIPYLTVATGFVVFTVVQSIRTGGTPAIPPGVGPGIWLGVTGALLSAAPVVSRVDDDDSRGNRALGAVGIVSLLLAVAAVLFNLYWRTRFVVPAIGDPDTNVQNIVVAVAAVLYGVVALIPVVIAVRWIVSKERSARLAIVLLAAAAAVAGVFVWLLPVGRDLDAFHGIAQNTSTAGVGFEGFLAWLVAAAIVGTGTVLTVNRTSTVLWRAATRKCLVLIAAWCGGSAILRIVDLTMSSTLDLPAPPYNATALMAFDLVATVVATWLFVNSSGKGAPRLLLTLLGGVLFVVTVCRVAVGVALVPRVEPLNPGDITDVYGNTLAQQITSTFDVALCVLALGMFVIAFVTGDEVAKTPVRRRGAVERPEAATIPAQSWSRPVASSSDQWAPTTAIPSDQSALATAKIFRPEPERQAAPTDRVAEVLAESTRRFAAGTTYGNEATGQAPDGRDNEPQ